MNGNLGLEHLEQVPGDRFTFAVLISCEVELVGILESLLELGHRLLGVLGDDVIGLEVVFDVDCELAEGSLFHVRRKLAGLGQVTDVTDRCEHLVVVAQVLTNGLGFGW